MTLSLDGSTRYIGTDFIKLLTDGTSSNLATEQYVLDNGGGGGGGGDPIDAYTKTEVHNLLFTKMNYSNPQDIQGTLRVDPTNSSAKIVLNAVGAPNDEDFYVNGDAYVNGNLRGRFFESDSSISIQNNVFVIILTHIHLAMTFHSDLTMLSI